MKKTMRSVIAVYAVSVFLTGCAGTSVTQDRPQPDTSEQNAIQQTADASAENEKETKSVTPETTVENEKGDIGSAKIYYDRIKEMSETGTADRFSLINVDDDDIPELVAVSSEGSWDKDQVFLYTISDNDAVLLISDIAPGMEGHGISYYQGENIVAASGAASGDRLCYYRITDGKLEPFFSAEYFSMDEDHYLINEEEVSSEEYNKALSDFLTDHGTPVEFNIDSMDKVTVTIEDDHIDRKIIESLPYKTFEEIVDEIS